VRVVVQYLNVGFALPPPRNAALLGSDGVRSLCGLCQRRRCAVALVGLVATCILFVVLPGLRSGAFARACGAGVVVVGLV